MSGSEAEPIYVHEPPVKGETRREAVSRQWRNRTARLVRDGWRMDRCRRCGLVRINVVHHVTPEQQAWAGDSGYFDGVELHEFEEPGDMSEPFTALAGLAAEAEQRPEILAIDPGSEQSAWVTWDSAIGEPGDFGIDANETLLARLRGYSVTTFAAVVIEKIEGYGMPVGAEVFETVRWAGRFEEACQPTRVERLGRKAIKIALCGSTKAKDPNIRQALIDRFTKPGQPAIGTTKARGPLYGVSKDVWAALAVAVAWADGAR
jgi:hypothetical protein